MHGLYGYTGAELGAAGHIWQLLSIKSIAMKLSLKRIPSYAQSITSIQLTHLVSVTEALVLLVRLRSPDLRVQVLLLILFELTTALVLPDVVHEEQDSGKGATSLGAHNGDLGGAVLGRVSGLEGLGTDDVTEGERSGDDGGGEGALGSSAKVGSSPLCFVSSEASSR